MTNSHNKKITTVLAKVDENYRIPFLMKFKGWGEQEISKELNLSPEIVSLRIQEARKQIKQLIQLHY